MFVPPDQESLFTAFKKEYIDRDIFSNPVSWGIFILSVLLIAIALIIGLSKPIAGVIFISTVIMFRSIRDIKAKRMIACGVKDKWHHYIMKWPERLVWRIGILGSLLLMVLLQNIFYPYILNFFSFLVITLFIFRHFRYKKLVRER